jgi:hypothetical protein
MREASVVVLGMEGSREVGVRPRPAERGRRTDRQGVVTSMTTSVPWVSTS